MASTPSTSEREEVRAYFPGTLASIVDEPSEGPFKDNTDYLRTLEALYTLQVTLFKISAECQQRVISHSSRDFGDPAASGVLRAIEALPIVRRWVELLAERLEKRGSLPLEEGGMTARFVRVCDVYGLSEIDRKIFGALLMQRTSHAFSSVKLGSQLSYAAGGSLYTAGSKPAVTMTGVLGISLTDLAAFQKSDRKHVRQGIVLPAQQLLSEMPALQPEATLLILGLPLNESQIFNIEKADVMRVLREEPGYKETRPKKDDRDKAGAAPVMPLFAAGLGGDGSPVPNQSLYSLLQREARREMAVEDAKPLFSAEVVPAVEEVEASALATAAVAADAKEAAAGEGGVNGTAAAKEGEAAKGTGKAAKKGDADADADAVEAEAEEEEKEKEVAAKRNGPYDNDLEYLQDMFQLVKLRSDVARVRRHMEERGQQVKGGLGGGGGGDEDGSDDGDMPPLHIDEPYYGLDEYSYEMEAMARGRFGRNMRHEASKQARHEKKRARKLEARAERLEERIGKRLHATAAETAGGGAEAGGSGGGTDAASAAAAARLPRLERLSQALSLSPFEKNVVVAMIGQAIAPRSIGIMGGGGGGGGQPSKTMQVEVLLRAFSSSLQDQIKNRRHFYKSAVLVREGILVLHGDELGADLTQTLAEIDRRMLDFVVGLDTEFSELMDGSHLYTPTVTVAEVVLAEAKKKLVLDTVSHFDTFTQASKDLELDKRLHYGRGMVLLFYGPSGTGKSMMANALANTLGKKVLMINFPTLGANTAGAILKLVFREAKIHDAVLFFDECESIFMDRTKGNLQVNTVLTELERHEGLCILATNRPMDLDEAMHRRITLAIEFSKPDLLLREKIWRSMAPPKLALASDVDFMLLARKFELSGGFIKNAWLTALSIAIAREGASGRPENLTLTQDDLAAGASHQLRGRLAMSNFDRGIVPQRGLEEVELPAAIKDKLKQMVNYSKAQAILFGQWGFEKQHGRAQGITALFHGLPGTGKTMAAEAIGFDIGRPLLVVNCAQLVDKYVGESAKNIEKVFVEAKAQEAVLVFDEAEGLFAERSGDSGSTSRHDSMNVGVLLHHMETFGGVCIAITNRYAQVDAAFHRRFKFILEFAMPDATTRAALWRLLVPKDAPTADDVDFAELGQRFVLSGGSIKSAVFRAAVNAALHPEQEKRRLTMEALCASAREEADKAGDGKPEGMYS